MTNKPKKKLRYKKVKNLRDLINNLKVYYTKNLKNK